MHLHTNSVILQFNCDIIFSVDVCSHYFNSVKMFLVLIDKWFNIYSIIEIFMVYKVLQYLECI